MQSLASNPAVTKEIVPFAVLDKTLKLLNRSRCGCCGASGKNTKKKLDAFNSCKIGVMSLPEDKLQFLKNIIGVQYLEIAYTDSRGVSKNVKV